MALTAEEVKAKFKPREKVVSLITRGDLLAEHEQVSAQLRDAWNRPATSLADDRGTTEMATRVRVLEAELAESRVDIRVRGMGRNAFGRLVEDHPAEDGKAGSFNLATFAPALIAACSVDPKMSVQDVLDLGDVLTDGQFDELYEAAFVCCREVDGVPFNALASLPTQD